MSRRKKLLTDVEVITAEYNKKGSFITELRLEDESLFFSYENGNKAQRESFVLHLNDYPDSSLLFWGSNSKVCTTNLQTILKDIVKEYNTKYGVKSLKASRNDSEEEEEYDEDIDDDLTSSGQWRTESNEDMEDELKDVYEQEMSYKDHDDLVLELNNYRAIFGPAVTKPMPLLETVDVEVEVPFRDILEESVCNAWGIDPKQALVCKFTFSADYFLDAQREPKIEFFQMNSMNQKEKKKFKLKYQLEAIISQFAKENWPATSGLKIKCIEYNSLKSSGSIAISKKEKIQDSGKKEEKKSGSLMGKIFGEKETKPQMVNQRGQPITDKEISQLIDMGFPIELSRNALRMTNTLDEATNLLLTDPDSCKHEKETASSSSSAIVHKIPGRVDELFTSPQKALTNEDKKKIKIDSKYGFIVMCITYIRFRMSTINDYCVICDQPHVFAHGNMLKPAVCSRELCCFSFQQLGVAGDAADDIATAAEVVDLLVCFATVAAKSPRNNVIFEPFPHVVDPTDPKKVILSPANKDFTKVNAILAKFPSVEKMSQAKDFGDMKKQMDKAHENAFGLLQWIITSNRSHIVKLNTDKHIKSMETTHQYLLLSAPPEKEAKFRQLKAQHGSVFAFHGSSSENWHSILRQGLKNASGTKLQVNGAAYGAGVYISPHAATSFGYCRMYGDTGTSATGGNRFLSSGNINCIAICEVINKDIRKSGTVWVQPNEEYVCTRFFFVFSTSQTGKANNCSTEDNAFVQEITRAMQP